LHKLLQYGPVIAAIDAGLTSFKTYRFAWNSFIKKELILNMTSKVKS
jgi:hypothetical protein